MNLSDLKKFESDVFALMPLKPAEIRSEAKRGIEFCCDDWPLERKFIAAKCIVKESIVEYPKTGVRMTATGGPGGCYGAWFFETNIGELSAIRLYDVDLAWDQIEFAFAKQRPDGYFPYVAGDEFEMSHHIGWATLAREIYELHELHPDREKLERVYENACRWTRWVQKHRDSNGDGIYESFHEFDIGVDRDPRYLMNETVWFSQDEKWVPEPGAATVPDLPMHDNLADNDQRLKPVADWSAGELMRGAYISAVTGRLMQAQLMMKASQDRMGKAKTCDAPRLHHLLPYSSPEVNAMVYCDLVYLGKIAGLLGKKTEAASFRQEAASLRKRVNAYLWHKEHGCYYDRDRNGNWILINTDAQMRTLNCGLPTRPMARRMFSEHLLNPDRFWTPFPFPSVSADDPAHLPNGDSAWHGPTLCLTPIRAFRAFQNYGFDSELVEFSRRMIRGMASRATFPQQWNPHTGKPGCVDLAPAMECSAYVYLQYIALLCGVIPLSADRLVWNCHALPSGRESHYRTEFAGRKLELKRNHSRFTAFIDGKKVFTTPEGTRIQTDVNGRPINQTVLS